MLDVETAEGNKVSKSFYYVGTKFWSLKAARKTTWKCYLVLYELFNSQGTHSNSPEAAVLRFVETPSHQNQLHQL